MKTSLLLLSGLLAFLHFIFNKDVKQQAFYKKHVSLGVEFEAVCCVALGNFLYIYEEKYPPVAPAKSIIHITMGLPFYAYSTRHLLKVMYTSATVFSPGNLS